MSGSAQGAAYTDGTVRPRGRGRTPRTTTLRLTRGEAGLLAERCRNGELGETIGRLGTGFDPSVGKLALTDAEIGRLIRQCSYGAGPGPGILRKIFVRALSELLVG